jgi:hypothetical protein
VTARTFPDVPQKNLSPAAGRPPRSLDSATSETLLVAGLVALGVVLRLTVYVLDPSLSVDEASLALNIMHRSYGDLFGELDFTQAAPAGFLILQKTAIEVFGSSAYALRLFPLVAGIGAVVLIFPVAKALIGRRPALLALALFAVSEPLISFASTSKQYSVDAAVTVGLYALAIAQPRPRRAVEVAAVVVAGAVAVWLSHPASFVLAAWGGLLIFDGVAGRRWRDAVVVTGIVTSWLMSFLAAYAFTRSSVEHVRHSIASSNPSSLAGGGGGQPGLLQTYGGLARSLLGIPDFAQALRSLVAAFAILLALAGLGNILRRNWQHALLLVLPAMLGLIACVLHVYPLYPRTFLFVVPALVMLVSQGVYMLNQRGRVLSILASGTFAVLLASTAYATLDGFRSTATSGTKQTLRYLAQHARPGDSLYLYLTSQYDYRYYLECGCFGTAKDAARAKRLWPLRPAGGRAQFAPALRSALPTLMAGDTTSSIAEDYRDDLQPARGRPRVWVLVIDANPNDQHGLEAFLHQNAVRKKSVSYSAARPPALLSLYDFRRSGT